MQWHMLGGAVLVGPPLDIVGRESEREYKVYLEQRATKSEAQQVEKLMVPAGKRILINIRKTYKCNWYI
jgi:hypothetical protein